MTPLEPIPDHELLKAPEAAAALGMDVNAFRRHLKAGRFPGAFRTPGMSLGPGRWRIPRADVVKVAVELGVIRS